MSIKSSAFEVVIAGGGFAGLRIARALARDGTRRTADGRTIRVTLIDRNNFFTYTPLLYNVAAGSVEARNAATPFRNLLWDRFVTTQQTEITGVDIAGRKLITSTGNVPYHRLVLAPGSVASMPSASGAATGLDMHANPFMTLPDAVAIRERLRRHCLRLVGQPATPGDLTVVIVGGGPKGVELTFDFADFFERKLLPEYGLPRERLRLVLLSGETRLMHEFDPGFDANARAAMGRRGIRLLTGKRVIGATRDRVLIEGGQTIAAQTVIWAAGTAPHPLLRDLGVPLIDRAVPVTDTLQLPGYPDVYIAGDCARTDDGHGNRVPATASLAQQHGRFLTRALAADLAGERLPRFQHVDRGNLVRFGNDDGYAELGAGRTAIRFRGPAASAFRTVFDVLEVPGLAQKRGALGDAFRVPGL